MMEGTTIEWTQLILTAVGGVIVFGVGLYQYVTTSSQTARQPFLKKQTDLCIKASEQAGRLATANNQAQWQKAWDEFWMLYWGPLAMVEDKSGQEANIYRRVIPSMIAFGDTIKPIGRTPQTLPVAKSIGLKGLSIDLSKACQSLIVSWWDVGISGWFSQRGDAASPTPANSK